MLTINSQTLNPSNNAYLKCLIGIFTLALGMRAGMLILNEIYFDLDPMWYAQSRNAIILALSEIGNVPLAPDVETFSKVTVEDAKLFWLNMDRGLVYVLLIIKWIFGQTSYLALQITQLIIDAVMVFFVAAIGRRLGGNKIAISASLAYAVFVPQIWLATIPEYNVWVTFAFVMFTWLLFRFNEAYDHESYFSVFLIAAAIFLIGCIGTQMRSVVVLAPLGMAGWYWIGLCVQRQTIRITFRNWQEIAALMLIGISVIIGSTIVNGVIRGEASPVRSTFGHSFWAGVGQFENPFGVKDSDASIAQYYSSKTGIEDTGDTGGIEYNKWLAKQGIEFIKNDTVLYLSMVARRGLMILFPNMPFTVVADLPAYGLQDVEIEHVKTRKALQAQYGRLSVHTISSLIRSDPVYIVGLLFRVFLLISLPIGVISFLVLSETRWLGILALFPLGYVLVTLAPYYITPVLLIPTHAAILPVTVAGWILLFARAHIFWKRLKFSDTT